MLNPNHVCLGSEFTPIRTCTQCQKPVCDMCSADRCAKGVLHLFESEVVVASSVYEEPFDNGKTAESCPWCDGNAVWREGNFGRKFLACSKFPTCKWTSYRKEGSPNAHAESI